MFHPTSFRRDERGNISILFAISAMLLLFVSGGAINFSDAIRIRQGLQAAADAAVLHGAVLDDAHHAGLSATERAERRVDGVRTLLASNLAGVLGSEAHATAQSADIAIDAQTGEVLLTLSYDYQPPVPIEHFSEAQPLSVTASADARQSATRDVSIVFVLDVSSSMSKTAGGHQPRIDALKDATGAMFGAIAASATDESRARDAIRTAMVAYDRAVVTSSPFTQGWSTTQSAIQALRTDYGTDSSVGLAWADNALSIERAFRTSRDGTPAGELEEILILVTDGNNYSDARDATSKATCDTLKGLGVTIYSIGIAAPAEGVAMLRNCASQSSSDPALTLAERTEGYMFEATTTNDFVQAFAGLGETILSSPARLTR